MVAVAYERRSFTSGSNFKNLTGKILGLNIKIFQSSERVIGGHLWEVVAYQRWSQTEDLNLQIETTFSRYDRLLALCIQFMKHFLFISALMKEIAWLMYGFCDSYNDRHFVCLC